MSDTIRIPVLNTGNVQLNISSITIDVNASTAFTFIGLASGRKGPPWVVPVKARDTLLVVYRSGTGRDNTSLTILHDDLTTARGSKNPWTIALRGVTDQPSVTIAPRLIDLGSICQGAIVERNVNITNIGSKIIDATAWTNSKNLSGIQQGTMSIAPTQVRQIPITYTASTLGPFADTVYVRIAPCDSI